MVCSEREIQMKEKVNRFTGMVLVLVGVLVLAGINLGTALTCLHDEQFTLSGLLFVLSVTMLYLAQINFVDMIWEIREEDDEDEDE